MNHPVVTKKLKLTWLLGHATYQRVCLRFWLMTSSVYVALLLLQILAAYVGISTTRAAAIVCAACVCGLTAFYVAMRTGWSARFNDPALTAQQMGFAFVMIAVSYVQTPQFRGSMLVVTPLVLMFGAFTLPPRQCRLLGLFAVLAQGLAIGTVIWLAPVHESAWVEIFVFLTAAVVFLMSADMAGRLSAIREQLRVQKRALNLALERNEQLARHDTLTELPNRRHATEMMEYEERRSRREKVPPVICMLDIDHFKQINDNFGHAAGDKVLRLLAKQALTALRSPDILARWGGEEFVLIMPETTVSEAIQVVERLRVLLAGTWVWKDHPELRVTFSAGVAALQNNETIQDTVARADEAMYLAKQQGRNRTIEASLEAPKSDHQKLQLVASR